VTEPNHHTRDGWLERLEEEHRGELRRVARQHRIPDEAIEQYIAWSESARAAIERAVRTVTAPSRVLPLREVGAVRCARRGHIIANIYALPEGAFLWPRSDAPKTREEVIERNSSGTISPGDYERDVAPSWGALPSHARGRSLAPSSRCVSSYGTGRTSGAVRALTVLLVPMRTATDRTV
jgi:hypothetical protein